MQKPAYFPFEPTPKIRAKNPKSQPLDYQRASKPLKNEGVHFAKRSPSFCKKKGIFFKTFSALPKILLAKTAFSK